MKPANRIESIHVQNFKAIQNSGVVRLTPFTAIIGNNGSGKSSLIEALEFFGNCWHLGLEDALAPWHGFEHIWNKFSGPATARRKARPLSIALKGKLQYDESDDLRFRSSFEVGYDSSGRSVEYLSQRNEAKAKNTVWRADQDQSPGSGRESRLIGGRALVVREICRRWQFLSLNAESMGEPMAAPPGRITKMHRDGRDVAGYLHDFQERFPREFAEFVGSIRFVVPYLESLTAEQSLDAIRRNQLSIVENKERIHGWLVSSGTLRITAIMACLMHPDPPKLLVIEEIENGLDPRTLGLVTSAIQTAVESGRTQVIATTHSPHFLDGVPPEYIMTVMRQPSGEPKFKRVDPDELGTWLDEFAPGRLYQMGVLTR